MGVPPGLCAVAVCVNVGSVASIWAEDLCFDRRCGGSEVGVSLSRVTFEPCQVLLRR